VRHALEAAKAVDFPIQTFGGTKNFLPQALAMWEGRAEAEEARRKADAQTDEQHRREHEEQERRRRLAEIRAALPEDTLETLKRRAEAFPASWQEEQADERSHDSRLYGMRFMLRLDDPTWEKLDAWSTHFETSGAAIIRQLLAQATPDTFPASWHLRAAERHSAQTRPGRRDAGHEA
jgi:hypothetical protein